MIKITLFISGITGKQELWKTCLDLTSRTIIDIMGHMYIKDVFQASKKKDVSLEDNIIIIFLQYES